MGIRNQAVREKWEDRLRSLGLRGRLPDALTEAVLEAVRVRPQGGRYTLPDGKIPGMYLDVSADGAASLLLRYRTPAARRTLKIATVGAMTLQQARQNAQAALAAVGRGEDPLAEKQAAAELARAESDTVKSYLEGVYWREKLKCRPKGEAAGEATKARILAAWEPLLNVPLAQLTRAALEKVLRDRLDAKKSAGTVLRDWSAFRAMLADAVDRGNLPAMPVARRPAPLKGLRDEPRVRWLGENDSEEDTAKSEGEMARFLRALRGFESAEAGGGEFMQCTATLALNTGMRRGELARLRDNMIKLQDGRIDLPGEVCKSGKGRPVHLNPDAIAAIKTWREVRKGLKVENLDGALFPWEPEHSEDRITQREFPRLCEEAGIDNLTFHDLRHTHAALLVKAGVPMIEVRDALGHASIVTTEKHYAHLAPSAVRKSVQALRVI